LNRFEFIFRSICSLAVTEDGMSFDPATVRAQRIKEDEDYEGIRVTFLGYLERARIPMQIDIGFGDTIRLRRSKLNFPRF
jgi:6-phosphofructokinase